MLNINEIWKDILGFEGLYQVSNYGRVKSLERSDAIGRKRKERILKPQLNNNGYYLVPLWKQSIGKAYQVHRLVWSAFNGPIPEGYEINHLDESPVNNALSNLSLVTHKKNVNYGTRNERAGKVLKNRKDLSKSVMQYDLQDNFVKEYASTHQAERETGFAQQNICACCKGKLKQVYGYKWKYKE